MINIINECSKILNIPYPDCIGCGQCCKCASPSVPVAELLELARDNINNARDFLNVFVPFENIDEARRVNYDVVEATLKAALNFENNVSVDKIVFFRCRFISDDNRCLIYEDRPSFCRIYPESPFLVIAPGCGYEQWSNACKKKYKQLKAEYERIENEKRLIKAARYQIKAIKLLKYIRKVNNKDYNSVLLLPSFSLISPGVSWIKTF